MEYRTLGSTGLNVSTVAFGAGPVAQLLVGTDRSNQRATIGAAIEAGINWFDTAATYGDGRSEENLGRVLSELGAEGTVHVATKVRLLPNQLIAVGRHVRESVLASLRRLRLERITLLQIHNSITADAAAQPTSITPAHVLSAGGMLEEMDRLRRQGLVAHLGLTGLGEPEALASVIDTDEFQTIQIPYHVLNPSAGREISHEFRETNHGNLITRCSQRNMGVFAIRVFAGGALLGQPPSPHTYKTPFFPLELYERDCRRAEGFRKSLPPGMTPQEAAVRFALSHAGVTSAIVGLATPAEVADAAGFATAGRLDGELLATLNAWSIASTLH
jgi:aryl-alcohol dehydrogenase-like predicted oxidoreductase